MPNPVIPVPEFPNVAQLPGVPQLVRATAVIGNIQLAVSAVQSFLGNAAKAGPTWGIFDSQGNLVVNPDSFYGFDDSNDWRTSDFPVQDGQFESYNKVMLPPTNSIKMTKGGTLAQRKSLLDQISAIAGDTNLYSILTPERTYVDRNITRWAIRRQGREGAYYFADLEIFFRNIQQTTSQYSTTTANTANAQNPAATPTQNLGTQLPQLTVPTSVQSIVTTAISNTPH